LQKNFQKIWTNPHSVVSSKVTDGGFNDDDVFFPSTDAPMTELNSHKRSLRSSRSTDAKTSETSVVDDATQPPPNSSPGEQQQQQRVYKKANKRVNKKVKRES
jgi:hypothetical protein